MGTSICDWIPLATQGVQALSPYVPGKPVDELTRELGLTHVVKLASNENPLGPSQHVLKAIEIAAKELHRYPDGSGYQLKQILAEHLGYLAEGLVPAQLTLGNGSNEILELVVRAFVNPGDKVMYSAHAFAVYALAAQAAGAVSQVIPARDWGHDLEAMLDAIIDANNNKPRVVFIANPNNPTGTWLKEGQLYDFLKQVPPEVIVVVDQAYSEYMLHPEYPQAEKWLGEFSNLIVTRTFSKAYGLAAVRIGYGCSSHSMAEVLNRVRQPFNANHIAQMAAIAALEDQDYLQTSIEVNQRGLAQIEKGLKQLQLSFIPTEANFICFNVGCDAGPVNQSLLKEGVILRPVANYGMPNWLRVSVGTAEENDYFLAKLVAVLTA